ncbi:MAG: thioredoxin family protein [Ignavibacteria bacterium]|nr:thioredoxin family protein [Ignavibacteria bacterium]
MALAYSQGMPPDTKAPDFSLPGTDGNMWSLASFRDAELLVVVFTCNHCPYAIASEDRLIALHTRFAPRARFVLINPNDETAYPDDSFDAMVGRARDKDFPFPYVRDASQAIARAYDAACTPDIFVFDQSRALRYNGRIDDNWQHPEAVTRRDLETVLEDLLAGRDISIAPVPSMGCSIKWK